MIVRMSTTNMNKIFTIMIMDMIITIMLITMIAIDTIEFYSQLSIIDLVESIYSSLDKTSRTFYWQRLQGDCHTFHPMLFLIIFILFILISVVFFTMFKLINSQGRSTSSWRTLTSTWRRRRASFSLCSTSKENSQPPISFALTTISNLQLFTQPVPPCFLPNPASLLLFTLKTCFFFCFSKVIQGISTTRSWCR